MTDSCFLPNRSHTALCLNMPEYDHELIDRQLKYAFDCRRTIVDCGHLVAHSHSHKLDVASWQGEDNAYGALLPPDESGWPRVTEANEIGAVYFTPTVLQGEAWRLNSLYGKDPGDQAAGADSAKLPNHFRVFQSANNGS